MDRPEAVRVGGPGENARGIVRGGGWGGNCYRVDIEGAET